MRNFWLIVSLFLGLFNLVLLASLAAQVRQLEVLTTCLTQNQTSIVEALRELR